MSGSLVETGGFDKAEFQWAASEGLQKDSEFPGKK